MPAVQFRESPPFAKTAKDEPPASCRGLMSVTVMLQQLGLRAAP